MEGGDVEEEAEEAEGSYMPGGGICNEGEEGEKAGKHPGGQAF